MKIPQADLMSGKGFWCDMPENRQADCVQSPSGRALCGAAFRVLCQKPSGCAVHEPFTYLAVCGGAICGQALIGMDGAAKLLHRPEHLPVCRRMLKSSRELCAAGLCLRLSRAHSKVGVHAMQKTVILNQNRDFLQLYRRGRKIVSPYMILYVRKNRRKYNRLGITVGKKVGCAVKRNRARRIIRQAYRETEHLLPTGIDFVIVALPAIDGIRSTQLRDYLAGNGLQRIRRMFAPPEGGKS